MPIEKGNLTISSRGRSVDGSNTESYLIGVAGKQFVPTFSTRNNNTLKNFLSPRKGGSASGKTSVAERILKNLNVPWVVIISMDSFYNILSPEQSALAHAKKSVEIPIYNFNTHSREQRTKTVYGANVIIFEGIFALHEKKIMDLMDLKIFVDTDADIRLARRLKRDIAERGRELDGVLQQYMRFVKPSFDDYVQPTVKNADVIIPRGLENAVAIDLITKHIQKQLQDRPLKHRWDLAKIDCSGDLPPNVVVLKETNQIKGMHTILRDVETSRDDFIFYAERLSTLIIEKAFSELPHDNVTVTTPVGHNYEGKRFKETDATVGTGAASLMAVRVLRDHDVPEENIIFLTFLAASAGLHVLSHAFPKIKIITSMVDPVLNTETLWIEPGIGNFGGMYTSLTKCTRYTLGTKVEHSFVIDRYYGTEEDE
ncbi:hypothetical protein NQZ79_g5104 [Umbelopsis isabellina]|nr:hypothetical protein NQZ79_g5104 [Umbelopsis isabellina]